MAYNLRFDEASEVAFLQQIRASAAAGLAIWVQREHDVICCTLTAFQQAAFPVVLVDRYLHGVDTDFVVADNEALGYHFTKTLLDKGHTRIGYLREGKRYATVAVGCTGGKHRSVAMAENLSARLVRAGMETAVVHRDLGRG